VSQSSEFSIQRAHHIEEIGQPQWDRFAVGRPFASYRWMRLGETVMADSAPTYVTLSRDGQPVAAASFWRVTDEPLPLPPLVRTPVAALLRRRPLLICRAPLANWIGMLLPDTPSLRSAARAVLHAEGLRLLQETRGSYLLFDFIDIPDLDWPGIAVASVSDAGTRLAIQWDTFDDYLTHTDKRGRQHYKRIQREAAELGLEISQHTSVANVDEAILLIRAEERKFKTAPNPWMRPLLENFAQVDGIWQEVRQRGRLVGCGLLLEDNGVMLATALGLADVPYAYFLLIYACLQNAIQRRVKTLRLGSGAYDVKRRLGCELESNNNIAFDAQGRIFRQLAKWLT